jgi:hypothetical protein
MQLPGGCDLNRAAAVFKVPEGQSQDGNRERLREVGLGGIDGHDLKAMVREPVLIGPPRRTIFAVVRRLL